MEILIDTMRITGKISNPVRPESGLSCVYSNLILHIFHCWYQIKNV